MPNSILQEAIKEAYAANPSDIVIIDTLELRHSLFVDIDGNSTTAFRITNEPDDIIATLEADAPLNPGAAVTFMSYPFGLKLPKIDDNAGIELTVEIDNVDRTMVMNVERALNSTEPIMMTYRPYLSNDLSEPQYLPVSHLPLVNVKATVLTISGKARFADLANKSFPGLLYTSKRFPGLNR